MNFVRRLLARLLYEAGDFVSRVLLLPHGRAYTLYSRLMIWSSDLDVEGHIWKEAE